MKKRALLLIVALLLLVAVPNAFAAVTDEQQKTIDSVYQQIANLQKQLIRIYADAGEITAAQGQAMEKQIDVQQQYQQQYLAGGDGNRPDSPVPYGLGFVPPCHAYSWSGNAGASWGTGMMGGAWFGGPRY